MFARIPLSRFLHRLLCWAAALFALLPPWQAALAEEIRNARGVTLAVLVPDLDEPYREVFKQIVAGIESRAGGPVTSLPVGDSTPPQEVQRDLQRRGIQHVIALGRQGLRAASTLERDTHIVIGAIVATPETEVPAQAVHSLAPDPALLFARLRQIAPDVRRVFVVIDPRRNAWLMRLAREAARAQGLELSVHEASDLRVAVRTYQEVLNQCNPRSDALWLAQDPNTVDDATVLPFLLQEAWNRSLPLFSSSTSHARRGVLFSLAPDNLGLGRTLAASVLDASAGGREGQATPIPLRDVRFAVNLRTAAHLGLSARLRGLTIDLSYPPP